MKRLALLLALLLCLSACTAPLPPPETTAPPQTTAPVEPTLPPETAAAMTIGEAAALLHPNGDAPNWLFFSLGCLYEKPEDIDLSFLFYLGVNHPGSWNDICEESRQTLIDQGFLTEMDLQIMPAEKLEEALRATFGMGLTSMVIPESWAYIATENAYCSNNNDAFFPGVPNITAVEDDGKTIVIHYTIDGYWLPDSEEFLDPAELVLTLNRQEDSAIHAVSNVLAPAH